jgi:hypothetical protein
MRGTNERPMLLLYNGNIRYNLPSLTIAAMGSPFAADQMRQGTPSATSV